MALTALLTAENLYRFYHAGDEETFALQGVSIQIDAGELVAVTGPSGSGKSTLLACLAGLDEPDGGVVHIAGDRLSRRSEEERARIRARGIGVLYQSSNLVGHLPVEDNLALAQRLAGLRNSGEDRRNVLDEYGLRARSRARPAELSGGELARAGLAVAMANKPRVLLADEPTGELDETTASHILSLLRERARAGSAVLIVTHAPSVAASCDREIRLRDGRVEE